MSAPDIQVGARVSISAGQGYIRWVGDNPKFRAGRWVGIELDTPTGKNDGEVQGERYFTCKPGHGVFIPPPRVTVLEPAPARTPRPSTMAKTPSSSSVSRLTGSASASASGSRASTPGSRTSAVGVRAASGGATAAAAAARAKPPTPTRATSRASTSETPTRLTPSAAVRRQSAVPAASSAATPRAVGVRPRPSTAVRTPAPVSAVSSRRQSSSSSALPSPVPPSSTFRPASSVSLASTPSRGQTPSNIEPVIMGPPPVPQAKSTTAPRTMGPPPVPATSSTAGSTPARSVSSSPVRTIPTPQSPRRELVTPSPVRRDSAAVPPSPRRESMVPSSPRRESIAVPSSPRGETVPVPASPRSTMMAPPATTVRSLTPTEIFQRAITPHSEAGQSTTSKSAGTGSVTLGPPLSPRISPRLPLRAGSPDRDGAASAAVFAQKRELDEMRIKIRLLEARRTEDQERIKTLEKKATNADQLHAVRAKLQAKFQEQQAALATAQRKARDLESENTHLETRAAESLDQLEMATLDREVAEEKAEAAESELARLNEKIQELELEVAVLNEENAEYEKPVAGIEGERSSLAFVQLEKHNERLKEALIRLRDMSTETEKEQRSKITELEKEIAGQADLSSRLDLAEARLASSEAQVEDLKQQLDDALGAEDLIEELTERNLAMSEKIEEQLATIEDYEALKELADEIEEAHVATEKQLEEEITILTLKLHEENSRGQTLEADVLDMETTISQFRELVVNFQSEIDSLRVQQATQEYESQTASKESQALRSINLKLQSSAAKTQSKTIDLELKKLEAAQLTEHLRIVQEYLPSAYLETEADSTTALLFFYRVASKVDMLITVISNLHGLPAALHSAASEALVGVCELRGKLRHFATLNRRFAAVMRRTESDDWVGLGKVVGELVGVEPKVDGWVALAKTDEFNEADCARELDSLIAQFNHLAEVMFARPTLDAGEQQLALAYQFDDDLDNFAAAVGFVRQSLVALVAEGDVEIDVGEATLEESVYEPVQRILNQVRAVKAPAGKLITIVEDTVAAQTALLPEFSAALGDLVLSVSNAVDIAVQVAQRVNGHVSTVRASKSPLRITDIDQLLSEITSETGSSDQPPWDVISAFISRLSTDLGDMLPKFRGAANAGQTFSLEVPPPWLARVAAIQEAASHNAEAESKVMRLMDELKDVAREVKLRDQRLEESGVKIETLERRLEGSRKQADLIMELETDVSKARKQEKVYEEALEQLQADQDALEAENARLRKRLGNAGLGDGSNPTTPGDSHFLGVAGSATPNSMEAHQLAEQVEALRCAVRFLRQENSLLRAADMFNDINMLTPLRHTSAIAIPPLPELDSGEDTDSDSDALPVTPRLGKSRVQVLAPNSRAALGTQSKLLLRELASYAAAPRIVDLSGAGDAGKWVSRKNSPAAQQWRLEKEREGLENRVKELAGRVGALRRL